MPICVKLWMKHFIEYEHVSVATNLLISFKLNYIYKNLDWVLTSYNGSPKRGLLTVITRLFNP